MHCQEALYHPRAMSMFYEYVKYVFCVQRMLTHIAHQIRNKSIVVFIG